MATNRPQFHYLRDHDLIVRTDDGAANKTDITKWVDCGLAAPEGDGTQTEARYQRMDLVIDIAQYVSDDNADAETITVTLQMTNTEDGTTAGTGDTSATDLHEQQILFMANSLDGFTGRIVIPIHNYGLDKATNAPATFRFVGVKFDFAAEAGLTVKWGAFISKCD